MGLLVLECVGPGRGAGGHGGVVVQTVPAEHVEHLFSAHGEEGDSHTLDVRRLHAGVSDEKLCLSDDIIGPLLLVEVGSEGVSDDVGRDLVAPCVHTAEQVLVERLVEIVDGIVEGEQDELGDLVGAQAAEDILAATVTISESGRRRGHSGPP